MFTGEANGLFFGRRFAPEEDVIRTQLEQVFVSIIKAIFQAIGDFHFVVDVALRRYQTLGQAGIQTAVEEVGQRNMLCLRYLAHGALGQVAVGDHQVDIRRQVVNRAVSDRDIAQSGILDFLTQYPGAHGAGTHTGVAGNDDFTHVAKVVSHVARRQRRRRAFGLGFHVVHATGCGFDIVFFFHFAGFQQDGGDNKGDRHRRNNGRDVSEVGAFWRHRQYRQNGTRGSRGDQAAVEDSQGEDTGHTAEDNGQNQTRVHQHVREVNFVDTAQEVDDCRTARRLLRAAAAKEHVRQQNAHPRTRVSFNQEEDGFAKLMGLLNTQRREDTVVNRVIEEQDFRRFNKDRRQRQHVVRHHEVNASRQQF